MNMHTKPTMAGFHFRWTDDHKSEAARLWNEGLSASQICGVFGVSRNSVIGIAHRNPDLFMKKGDVYKGHGRGGKPKQEKGERRITIRSLVVDEVDEPMPDPTSYDGERLLVAKDLMARNDATDCHWPLNSGGPFVYCCAPKVKGSSYCGPHANRARSFRAEAS